jgi:hypothetical protein
VVAQLDLAFGENFNLSGSGVGRSTGAAVILFIPRTFHYHWIIAMISTPRRCCLEYSRILIAVIGFVMTPCCVYWLFGDFRGTPRPIHGGLTIG